MHGQGERRAHQFLHLDLCPPRWLFGHPPYFASRCKAGSLMCDMGVGQLQKTLLDSLSGWSVIGDNDKSSKIKLYDFYKQTRDISGIVTENTRF